MKNKQHPSYYSAVVVINPMGQVLLGKRKEDGIWTTPAGSAEPGEESPAKTACRELFEEAGIPCTAEFLQALPPIETSNGKICHCFLYVAPTGIMTTSKLDPDQEVKTWKWFSMDEIPNDLRDDPRRFESVRNGYMKFHGVQKSLIESLEKGGKPAGIGEVRNFGGKDYQKMGDGSWKPVVHPEEKQLEAEQSNKVVSLTEKLKQKIEQKNQISQGEKHLHDLKNQVVVEGKQTRSEKPMFSKVDAALAHGYSAEDFREVGNMFYDRAQKMAETLQKLKDTNQKIDPTFEKIKQENLRISRAFISQANHIDDRQAKTKAGMKKSTVMMGHADAAEVNTADYAIEQSKSQESGWLSRFQAATANYEYGEEPRVVVLDKGDLHLVKVEEGLYSGIFKVYTEKMELQDADPSEAPMVDNAKVRIERMTLPSLVQFCIAKEWILPHNEIKQEEKKVEELTQVLQSPTPVPQVESEMDKKIRILELINKLVSSP